MREAGLSLMEPRVRWGWIVASAALYVAFLVASAPASVLAWALAAMTNGVVTVAGVQGSVWHGHALALIVSIRPSSVHRFEQLRWNWLGTRLVAGELAYRIKIEDRALHGATTIALSSEGVRADDATFRLPAASASVYLPQLAAASFSGDVSLQSEQFLFSQNAYRGVATVEWRNAASTLSDVRPLGEYRVRVTGRGPQMEFSLITLGGALHLEGLGTWSQREGFFFKGDAQADAANQSRLIGLLRSIGKDSGKGAYSFRI